MKKENSMRWIYAVVLLAGLIIGSSLIGYYLQGSQKSSEGTATLIIKVFDSEKTERFKFSEGTPIGILEYNHRVKTVLNGNFIECIDDACADGNYWWIFTVNNKTLNYGVNQYRLKEGDVIMLEFTKRKTGEKE